MIRQSVANIDMRDISGKKQLGLGAESVDLSDINIKLSQLTHDDDVEEAKISSVEQRPDFEILTKCESHV